MYRKFIYLLHNPRSRTITSSLFIGLIQIFVKILVFICLNIPASNISNTKSHNTIMSESNQKLRLIVFFVNLLPHKCPESG